MEAENKKLFEFLSSIQLDSFYVKISINLGATRLEHLENLKEDDLVTIGLSAAEIRRFFDNVKKLKRRSLFSKFRKSFRIIPGHSSPDIPADVRQETQCIIEEKELTFGDVIGSGAFGYVQQAEWINHTTKNLMSVAVKILQQSHPQTPQTEFIQEANAMVILTHPNLIRLYGVVLSTPFMLENGTSQDVDVKNQVTELAPLGSLSKRLKVEPEKFLISNLCSIVIQIAAGMKYLEAHRVVHRDLAARNILLMSYEKTKLSRETLPKLLSKVLEKINAAFSRKKGTSQDVDIKNQVKIGDFGLARPLQQDSDCYVMESNGLVPYAWCAPECLNYRKFSHASDIWAFGITVMEIFSCGNEPWVGLTGTQILQKIDEPNFERPKCPEHCPKSIFSIIKDLCWNHIPENRGQFSLLLKSLLSVLPHEVRALNDRKSDNPQMLSFLKTDLITVFDNNEEALWRGQNRSTLQVGIVPAEFVDLSRGTISDTTEEATQIFHGTRPSSSIDDYRLSRIMAESHSTDGGSPKERLSINRESYSSTCSSLGTYSQRYSFCEECSSHLSGDSGIFCRCSTYSSCSSKRSSGTSDQSTNVTSKPIGIPGGKYSMKNHRKKGDIYEEFPYDSRSLRSSTPKSITSDMTSFSIGATSSPNNSITSENLYDNIEDLCIKDPIHKSGSIGSRQSLPDIVNPVKQTKILDRRRSLPRLRNNKRTMKSFENKLYRSQSSVSTDTSQQDEMRCRSATDNTNSRTHSSVFYDNVPSPPKIDNQPEESVPYQSHKQKKTTMNQSGNNLIQSGSNEPAATHVLYDLIPSPVPKQDISKSMESETSFQVPLYEEIGNVISAKNNTHATKTSDMANDDVIKQPLAPPRIKKKQRKTSESDNQAKIKQCVILKQS